MKNFTLFISIIFLFICIPSYSQTAEKTDSPTIMQAVVNNDIFLLAETVRNEVNIDEQDEYGATPLIYATKNGTLLITDILIRLGADPNIRDKYGFSAIDWAHYMEDNLTSSTAFKKGQIIENAIKKPFIKKIYQRVLFNPDTDTATVLNCDSLIETKETLFCQIKMDDKSTWELYSLNGENIDIAQDVEKLSHNGKEYFILEKWGEYSIIFSSGIPLREHLKQVKYTINKKKNKSGELIFNVINVDGKKESFSPDVNTQKSKK